MFRKKRDLPEHVIRAARLCKLRQLAKSYRDSGNKKYEHFSIIEDFDNEVYRLNWNKNEGATLC